MNTRNMPQKGAPGPKWDKIPKGKNIKKASEEALHHIEMKTNALTSVTDAAKQLLTHIKAVKTAFEAAKDEATKSGLKDKLHQMELDLDQLQKTYKDQENWFNEWLYGHKYKKGEIKSAQSRLLDETLSKEARHTAKMHIQQVKGRKPREIKKWKKLDILKYPSFPK